MTATTGGDLAKGVSEVFAFGTTLIVGTVIPGITLRAHNAAIRASMAF
jgi:hypothetical protein